MGNAGPSGLRSFFVALPLGFCHAVKCRQKPHETTIRIRIPYTVIFEGDILIRGRELQSEREAGEPMSSTPLTSSQEPEYAWEVATLFPEQGEWSEEAFLELTDHSNRRIEFTDGRLEFLPMPSEVHEALVRFLFLALYFFVEQRKLGEVYSNGIRLRIRPRKVRLPDIIFLHKDHFHARHNRVWDGADLVMEVVSDDPKDHVRDYEVKLADYAEAKVAEYWIIDPERKVVIVHRLEGERYDVHGEFTGGQHAASALLSGFSVDVTALFAAAADIPE
jgi:Uma2 family endonuclease